jgi:hypothetical protein
MLSLAVHPNWRGRSHSDDEINDEKPAPSTFSQSHRTIPKSVIKVLTQQDHDVHLGPIISTRSSLLLDCSQLTQVPIHSSLQNPREHRPRNPSTDKNSRSLPKLLKLVPTSKNIMRTNESSRFHARLEENDNKQLFRIRDKGIPSVKNPQQIMRVEKYILGDNFWRAMLFMDSCPS